MQAIPLPWQIAIAVAALAGVVVFLAVLARASRHGDQDGRFRKP